MHVEYKINDLVLGRVELGIEPDLVDRGGDWLPGVVPAGGSGELGEYFAAMINEGDIRNGRLDPEEEGWEEFPAPVDWNVVGQERDVCLKAMGYWLVALSGNFDPSVAASDIPDSLFSSEDARKIYERDRVCWCFYVDDLSEALDEVHEMVRNDFGFSAPRI